VASGSWVDPDGTDVGTDAWYRIAGHNLLGGTIVTSAVTHYIPTT
jgi:hypothetical protein